MQLFTGQGHSNYAESSEHENTLCSCIDGCRQCMESVRCASMEGAVSIDHTVSEDMPSHINNHGSGWRTTSHLPSCENNNIVNIAHKHCHRAQKRTSTPLVTWLYSMMSYSLLSAVYTLEGDRSPVATSGRL